MTAPRSKKIETPAVESRWIPLGKLRPDETLQQGRFNQRHAQQIADNLNLELLGQIHVWKNGGGPDEYSIIDGVHRVWGVRAFGFGDDDKIECLVHLAVDSAGAAQSFLTISERLGHKAVPKFNVRVRAGDPHAVAISDVLAKMGLRVGQSNDRGSIRAVAALERAYGGDADNLRRTLRLITAAWGHDSTGFDGAILDGVAALFRRYKDEVNDATLVKKLATHPGGPAGLIGKARGIRDARGGSVGRCLAGYLVMLYNRQRSRGKLADWWAS